MEFDKERYKIWDWRHIGAIHFMLNPGLAINELILGQRVPKVMLTDKESSRPMMERSYVPCPHCETLHDSRIWSSLNGTAYMNWFGMYCPKCHGIIPCLRNWTSAILLVLTYPLWFWWINKWKTSWLEKQPPRYENLDVERVLHQKLNWKKMGLFWGVGMFVTLSIILPPAIGVDYHWFPVLVNLPICLLGGWAFGYSMKRWLGRRGKGVSDPRNRSGV